MYQFLDALVFVKNAGILVVCRGFLQTLERKELVQIAGENHSIWVLSTTEICTASLPN